MKKLIIFLIILVLGISSVVAQQDPGNYNESKVPAYTLPDPLVFNNGSKVLTKRDWVKRMEEIHKLFSEEVYGIIPKWHGKLEVISVSPKKNIFDGLATREEVLLKIINGEKELKVLILIYLPNSSKPSPVFLGYNFYGNHTLSNEPDISLLNQTTGRRAFIGKAGIGMAALAYTSPGIIAHQSALNDGEYMNIPDFDN